MPRYIETDEFEKRIKPYDTDDPVDKAMYNFALNKMLCTPTADVVEMKHGKWEEKEVIHAEEAKTAIEEWQSCRCSVCDRYDTRPYMYYFDNPNYCSWCGAKMDGKETEDDSVTKQGRAVILCRWIQQLLQTIL